MSGIKVLALDFDGVVLESVAVKDQAIFDLFEDVTVEERQRVLDLHRKTPGINRRDRIKMLLTQGLGKEATSDLVDNYLDRFARLVWDGLMNCSEVLGVRSFLEEVSRQMPCYVVSAAPQEEVRAVAEKRDFAGYFIDIFGTPPGKKERLEEIMLQENVTAQSVLFVGDKISDYNAAKLVGTKFIGRNSVESGTDFPEEVMVIDEFQTNLLS